MKNKINEEFDKRHYKIGKFRLCFPFSNMSAELAMKINTAQKDSKSSAYNQMASSSCLMK